MKELVYTADMFDSNKAVELGLISREFNTHKEMMDYVQKLATVISRKSPVAVYMSKKSIN